MLDLTQINRVGKYSYSTRRLRTIVGARWASRGVLRADKLLYYVVRTCVYYLRAVEH